MKSIRDRKGHGPTPDDAPAFPARSSQLRQANARELLHLLQQHAPCSKADLVRLSGLSAPSVSSMIGALQAVGLVISMGEGESSGGRPPELLRFNARHAFVAGADIGGTRLRMMLADLNGTPVAQWSTVMKRGQKAPESICRLLHSGLREMCRTANISLRKVLHLTAGAPGITNVDTGTVLAAPNLEGWNDVPLRQLLQKQTGLAVTVENDVNLAAMGEHRSGAAKGVSDFIFIAIGTGVGAGVFVRNRIHHGTRWTAGEIGYCSASERKSQPVRMRSTGQLEDLIGGAAIERCWREIQEKPADAKQAAKLRAPAIFDLARDGNEEAARILQQTATILGDTITNIALLLNPDLVVLGGGIGAHPELSKATEALLSRNEFANPRIRPSVLGTEAQLFGAVAISVAAAEAKLLA